MQTNARSTRKEVLGFAERVLDFAPSLFQSNRKASSWFVKMLDESSILGYQRTRKCSQGLKIEKIEKGGFRYPSFYAVKIC